MLAKEHVDALNKIMITFNYTQYSLGMNEFIEKTFWFFIFLGIVYIVESHPTEYPEMNFLTTVFQKSAPFGETGDLPTWTF